MPAHKCPRNGDYYSLNAAFRVIVIIVCGSKYQQNHKITMHISFDEFFHFYRTILTKIERINLQRFHLLR